MSKSKTKPNVSAGKAPGKGKPRPAARSRKTPTDLNSLRQKISNMVAGDAVEMVNDVIAEVHKGQHTPMKYLFELIGLYPSAGEEEGPLDDSLVETLLRRLGFPEAAVDGDSNGDGKAAARASSCDANGDDASKAGTIAGLPVE